VLRLPTSGLRVSAQTIEDAVDIET